MDKREHYGRILRLVGGPLKVVTVVLLLAVITVQTLVYLDIYTTEPGAALPEAQAVAHRDEGVFGTVTVVTKERVSVPKAYLLINDKVVGDFTAGRLVVRVYEGDQLMIDSRNYRRELTFMVEQLSANIDATLLTDVISLHAQSDSIGTIHFK